MPGIFTKQVGLVDLAPQPPRRLDRAGGVASELGATSTDTNPSWPFVAS